MRIKNFKYYDKALEWKVETTLFPNLTLLVGISGVGKTQILDAISRIKNIANGKAVNGIQWEILFTTRRGDEYFWSGEYENKSTLQEKLSFWKLDEDSENNPKIVAETLRLNGQLVIRRADSEILLREQKTPKLSPFESVLSILNQEEEVSPAYSAFKRIIRSDFSSSRQRMIGPEFIEFNKMLKSKLTLEELQKSGLDSRFKIALVYYSIPEVFEQIKERFIDVFPQIEDVRFRSVKDPGLPFFDEYPLLEIKEKGVECWIQQDRISSGMYKTFMHISEMFLWPEGTVVLIDEFENSLGVNCIDVLTEDLIHENRMLQFIVTSHHPYIINNISPKYWKVVTRKGGSVTTHDANDLQIGDSSHKAFIQLINLDEFKEGIGIA